MVALFIVSMPFSSSYAVSSWPMLYSSAAGPYHRLSFPKRFSARLDDVTGTEFPLRIVDCETEVERCTPRALICFPLMVVDVPDKLELRLVIVEGAILAPPLVMIAARASRCRFGGGSMLFACEVCCIAGQPTKRLLLTGCRCW